MVRKIIKVEIAATVGSFSVTIYENISTGRVVLLETRKRVAVKLLNDTTNVNIKAEMIPSFIKGAVIFKKVFILFAPKDKAASSKEISKRKRLA